MRLHHHLRQPEPGSPFPASRHQDQSAFSMRVWAPARSSPVTRCTTAARPSSTVIGRSGVNGGSLIVASMQRHPEDRQAPDREGAHLPELLSNPEPTPARYCYPVRLSDGSGGVTVPQSITLNIALKSGRCRDVRQEQVVSRFAAAATGRDGATRPSSPIWPMAATWWLLHRLERRRWRQLRRLPAATCGDNPLGDLQVNIATSSHQDEPSVVSLAERRLMRGGHRPATPTRPARACSAASADGAAPDGRSTESTPVWSNQYLPTVSQAPMAAKSSPQFAPTAGVTATTDACSSSATSAAGAPVGGDAGQPPVSGD